jgi:hypothetical protein
MTSISMINSHDEFELSIDDLVAQLGLDNYCMIPCQN